MKRTAYNFAIAWIVLSILAMLVFIFLGIDSLTVFNNAEGGEQAAAGVALIVSVLFFVIGGCFIVPIIVNSIAVGIFYKLNTSKQLLILGVFVLILGINPVTSIILFCLKEDEEIKEIN